VAGQLGTPQEGRCVGGDIERRTPGAAGMDLCLVDLPGTIAIAQHQGEQRHVPGDVAVHQSLAWVGRQPGVEIVEGRAVLTLLVEDMSLDVGAVGVLRVFGHAALDQVERLVEPAGLLQREGIDALEPPVVGEMRLQRFEELDLLGLAALAAAEAYEAEHAGGGGGDHGIARMPGEVSARGGQRFDGLALQGKAERVDMALLARRQLQGELAGACRRLPRAGNVGHQEAGAGEGDMGQGEIGIGLDGARQVRQVAVRCRQQAVDAGDVSVARGGRRGAERQAVSVKKHYAVSPG
jgi:hypothetical protein